MPHIIANPRKTKPPDLPQPCASCDQYEETEAELHGVRKALWGNPNMRQHFRRCMYDPRLCDPDMVGRCPWAKYVGQPIVAVTCDCCGRIITCLNPADETTAKRLANKAEDGFTVFDVCKSCQNKGLDPSKQRAAVILSAKG